LASSAYSGYLVPTNADLPEFDIVRDFDEKQARSARKDLES
jgi:hypothetical protein